jgi:transposase-like protein
MSGMAFRIATSQKRETNRSWRMDETYIKVKGEWVSLYRAVDSRDTLVLGKMSPFKTDHNLIL